MNKNLIRLNMLVLTGKNLGERQRELNLKVIEAADKKIDLNEILHEETLLDVDKLFHIALASKYENMEFIVEMLKSEDSLYVTRALKCSWIYDDKYSDIMSPNYLHQNIFPHMSLRMKKKMLASISLHIRNEDRVICFYSYCMSSKFKNLALKFLIYTPETFKMDLIDYDDDFWGFNAPKNLKYFIGNSIELATAYVEMHSVEDRIRVMHEIRFLYNVFEERYIDMLEKYVTVDAGHPNNIKRLGIRFSRDIIKVYKKRLWKNVVLYINLLNKSMLVKYLTSEDVKKMMPLLLPSTAASFWSVDFYHSYKFILDLISSTEIFAYLRVIYSSKYENDLFEMNINFYNLSYYEIFTAEEQESWALLHIKRELELFGSGNDYIWYKFVRFDKAIVGIKQYVFITPDSNKRAEIVNILIYSAKIPEDLQQLLNYYYDRHVNESDEHKRNFLDLLITTHDVYDFTIECWTEFDKLLYSLEGYSTLSLDKHWRLMEYSLISMIYHILHDMELSENLQYFLENVRVFHEFCDIINALSVERSNIVIKYLLNFNAERLKVLLEKPHDDKVKEEIYNQICINWNIIWAFNRDKKECPEIVLTYMKSNLDVYKYHPEFRKKFEAINEKDFLSLLKTDLQKAIEIIPEIKFNSYRWSFKLNRLFRKLKVYFAHDVSEIYLKYFLDLLEILKDTSREYRTYRNIKIAIVGIFQLGSEELKISLLEKYMPVNHKIDHRTLNPFLFQVQKAICRLAYQSRPPIQLSSIQKYIIGDYVRFCLPIFDNYFVNLPMPRAVEFIHGVIDSPVSIQKHGLRLAFKCFSSQDLADLILKIWKKTKNVSLRKLLYKTLFERMVDEDGDSQKTLYEVLKTYTSELNYQDHEDVFGLLVSEDMPDEFKGDYIATAWKTVSEFSNKNTNLVRKTSVINHMRENIYLVNRDFMRKDIIDEHVRLLYDNKLKVTYNTEQLGDLMKAKWDLTAAFIVSGNTTHEFLAINEKLASDIVTKFMEMWDHTYKGIYTYRQICNSFLRTLHEESCRYTERYVNVIAICRCILRIIKNYLSKEELYLPEWKYKLSIKSREVIYEHIGAHQCAEYKYPCVIEIADEFAKKVGKLVKTLVDTKKFYHSIYTEMANALRITCETMGEMLNINSNGFKILVSGHLAQFKIKEVHVLAVMIIPKHPPKNWQNRHENALIRIKQFDNEEIQCIIYQKFSSFAITLKHDKT